MRIVTFNLWHGLAPAGALAFEALEPSGRRILRQKMQVELLRGLEPDICFFQEANPVTERAPELARALGMDFALQPDLVGLKLFGLGIPVNLNSGLVTAVRKSYGIKRSQGVSLSRPGTHLVYSWASWQLKEERFAQFSETMLPGCGKVLLINTHLHHGLEPTEDFLSQLDKIATELELAPQVVTEIKKRLQAGPERRAHELNVLLSTLRDYEKRFEMVLLAGDFNASPASDLGCALSGLGFRDVWQEIHPKGGGLTFDATQNHANHLMQSKFPLTLVVEDLSFSPKVKETLLAAARKQEARPRRIDYIWARTSSLPLNVRRAELAGLPDKDGFAPSDHFAVVADLEVG